MGAAKRLGKYEMQKDRLSSIASVLQADSFLMEHEAEMLASKIE